MMRRVIRGIIHILAFFMLVIGLLVLCAAAISWLYDPGVTTSLGFSPNGERYYSHNTVLLVREGRFVYSHDYIIYEREHEEESSHFQVFPGLHQNVTMWSGFVSHKQKWFAINQATWPDGFSLDPQQVYLNNVNFVLPAPLVGSALMIISLWWLAPAIKLWFRRRVRTNLCLHCGYNLTGVESDICPECGADRPLVTVSSQARSRVHCAYGRTRKRSR